MDPVGGVEGATGKREVCIEIRTEKGLHRASRVELGGRGGWQVRTAISYYSSVNAMNTHVPTTHGDVQE